MRKFLVILSSCMVSCLAIVCSLCILTGCKKEDPNENTTKVIPPEISFTVSEKTLTIGDEEYLFPVYQKTQGYALSYQSSNPAIVEVDKNGKISARSEGSATVSAIYSNGSAQSKADIVIKSSFSGYLPELKTLGVGEELAITLNGSYTFSPYVFFNGKEFNDVSVSYEIVNDAFAEVNEKGEVQAKAKGKTQIILQGTWRGKDKTGAPTMQKTVNLSVIDDVRFYNGEESIADQAIYTLSEFEGQSYQNKIPCDFKVSVNGNEETAEIMIEKEDILSIQGNFLVAGGFGETKVSVQKEVDGTTYCKDFTVLVQRIDKTVEERVPLFSTVDGTYLDIKNNQKKGILTFIGAENAVVDAYQGNKNLAVEGNKIFGVESSSKSGRGTAEISVGTDTVVYHFQVETLAKTIIEKEDLYALQLSAGKVINGYYELMRDIDATGIVLNHTVSQNACFAGVFNGNGHVISNLALTEEQSMFGVLDGTAIVKNLALNNLTATKAYFLAHNTLNDGLTVSNVYISLTAQTETPRGLTSRTGSRSVCENVVIEYLGSNAESNRNYADSQYQWQGLIGGLWRRVVEGEIYAEDTKWKDVYVISPFVVSFRANERNNISGEDKTAVYGYGANETIDIYGNSLTTTVHTRPNPNLGDNWWKETYVAAKFTNLYHYNNYTALETADVDYSSFDSEYWVVYNNRIIWKSIFESTVAVKIYDGNTEISEQYKLAKIGKELALEVLVGGQEMTGAEISVSVAENPYLVWDGQKKVLKVIALPEIGMEEVKITVKVKLAQGEITRTLKLTVRSLVIDPIHSGGNFDSGDNYEGYFGGIKEPIHSGGEYDGGDNYGD